MNQTPLLSLLGGALIGLSAACLLLVSGRIAGVSGILAGVLAPRRGEVLWRALFVAGLVAGGAIAHHLYPDAFASTLSRSTPTLAAAGLLVGFGTRLGNGCTSGHGVCGVGRLSPHSLAAVATFVAAGMATVATLRLMGAS